MHGFTYLMEVVDLSVNEADEQGLNDQDVDLCCEILKILFNLSLVRSNMDEVSLIVKVIEIFFFFKAYKV